MGVVIPINRNKPKQPKRVCRCGCGGVVGRGRGVYIVGHGACGNREVIPRCRGTSRGICGYPLRTEADRTHGLCEDCHDEIQIGLREATG